jgi:hypothetical protein
MEKVFYGCLLYMLLLDAVHFSPSEGDGLRVRPSWRQASSGIHDLGIWPGD